MSIHCTILSNFMKIETFNSKSRKNGMNSGIELILWLRKIWYHRNNRCTQTHNSDDGQYHAKEMYYRSGLLKELDTFVKSMSAKFAFFLPIRDTELLEMAIKSC